MSDKDIDDDPLMRETVRIWLQEPISKSDYYCISLLGNADGTVERSILSHWCGFSEGSPRYEVREGSPAKGSTYRDFLKETKLPYSIVNDIQDLYVFRLIGGWGVVIDNLAKRYFGDLVSPRTVAKTFHDGFISPDFLPAHMKNHAPTKKLRMAVIKRDRYRCKVCGRSPKDYVDVELHVHHIMPWALGGMTEEENLITLCKTCHDGLDPHCDLELLNLMDLRLSPPFKRGGLANRLLWYMEGISKTVNHSSSAPHETSS